MKLNLMGLLKMRNDIFYVIFLSILLVVLFVLGYVVFDGIDKRIKGLERFNNQISILMESDDKQVENNRDG